MELSQEWSTIAIIVGKRGSIRFNSWKAKCKLLQTVREHQGTANNTTHTKCDNKDLLMGANACLVGVFWRIINAIHRPQSVRLITFSYMKRCGIFSTNKFFNFILGLKMVSTCSLLKASDVSLEIKYLA